MTDADHVAREQICRQSPAGLGSKLHRGHRIVGNLEKSAFAPARTLNLRPSSTSCRGDAWYSWTGIRIPNQIINECMGYTF